MNLDELPPPPFVAALFRDLVARVTDQISAGTIRHNVAFAHEVIQRFPIHLFTCGVIAELEMRCTGGERIWHAIRRPPDASGVAAGAGRRLVEYLQFATGHVSRRCKYKNIPPEWPLYPDGGGGRDPVCDVNLQIYQRDGWLVSRGCDKSGR